MSLSLSSPSPKMAQTHPFSELDQDHLIVSHRNFKMHVKAKENLQQDLIHVQNALATVFTPGHEQLKAQYEDAKAAAKIAAADVRVANARAASATAAVDVVKLNLDNQVKVTQGLQDLLKDKRKEVEKIKKEMKGVNQRESTLKKKVKEMTSTLKDNKGKVTDMNKNVAVVEKKVEDLQQELADAQEKTAEMKALLKDFEGKVKKLSTREKKLVGKAEKMEREATTMRNACKELEDQLKEERKSFNEKEAEIMKDMQENVAKETARVKEVEKERKEWKRKAEVTSRRLKVQEERSTRMEDERNKLKEERDKLDERRLQLEEVHRSFTLPPAQSLQDGNNSMMLSPAPLAKLKGAAGPSNVQAGAYSGSAFSPVPFVLEETDAEKQNGKKPGKKGKAGPSEADTEALTPRRGRSASLLGDAIDKITTRKNAKLGKRSASGKAVSTRSSKKDKEDPVEVQIVPQEAPSRIEERSRKRRRMDKKEKVEASKNKDVVQKGRRGDKKHSKDSPKSESAAASASRSTRSSAKKVVERVAGGRKLRNQRPVSYDYNEAGRDVSNWVERMRKDGKSSREGRELRKKSRN